jgi:hypothetical protein
MNIRPSCLFFMGAILLQGCGVFVPATKSESKLAYLNIGQDKAHVLDQIGTPDVVRGSRKLEDGRTLEVAEYRLYESGQWAEDMLLGPLLLTIPWWVAPTRHSQIYWLQYIDGKLERWGHAGDWQPDVTGDFTIRQR